MLTDRLPYGEINSPDVYDHGRFEQPLILASRLNIQTGAALDRILSRALAIEAPQRYPSAKELLADLEGWRPESANADKSSYSSESTGMSKAALGTQTPANEEMGQKLAQQALALSRQVGRLKEAADLMEEAFNKSPTLRERYDYRLTLWRRGVSG